MSLDQDRATEQSEGRLRVEARHEGEAHAFGGDPRFRRALLKGWVFPFVVLAVGLGMRLPILLAGTETILSHWGSDDLFYFTGIASYLSNGDGLTFDGIHPTTGVQPLWLLFLAPFGRWFAGNGPLALRVVLWMVTSLTLITAMLFPWVCRKLIEDDWAVGWLAALLWVAHPRVLGMTFEGTEGALIALAWLVALGVWKTEKGDSRSAVFLGIVLGLGCLVRVDFLVVAAVLLVFKSNRVSPRPFRRLAVAAVALVLVAGTWPAVCWWINGSPLPDSGVAKALHADRLAELQGSGAESSSSWGVVPTGVQSLRYLMTNGGRVSRISMVVFPLSLVLFVVLGRSRRRRWSAFPNTMKLAVGMWPLIMASALLLVLYPAVLRSVRSWYVMGPLVMVTLLTAAFVTDLQFRLSKRKKIAGSLMIAAWLAAANVEAYLSPKRATGSAVVRMCDSFRKHAFPGARAGAFNAGIPSAWAAKGTTVINLDGVVNHSAIKGLRERDLVGYIDTNQIEFIIDNEASVRFFDAIGGEGLLPRLQRLETLPLGGGRSLGVWRVCPKGGGSLEGENSIWSDFTMDR